MDRKTLDGLYEEKERRATELRCVQERLEREYDRVGWEVKQRLESELTILGRTISNIERWLKINKPEE